MLAAVRYVYGHTLTINRVKKVDINISKFYVALIKIKKVGKLILTNRLVATDWIMFVFVINI